MIEYLSDLRLLREISRTLNFRQAGEKLGYSPAVVSMRVKRLETVTGKTLFLRSTRHITMTEEGKELLALAEKTLDLTELMTAPRHSDQQHEELRGTVRITAPHSFARVFLLQPIQQIHMDYPHLTIELLLEDHITELVQEGIDISFRVGGHEQSGTDSQPLMRDRRILVASPGYLEEYGAPQQPTDLHQHQCLSYTGMKHWTLSADGKHERITLQQAMYCNTGDYLRQLAVNGTGITAKSDWSVHAELSSEKLVRVLENYTLGADDYIRVLTPKREVTPVRVRRVMIILQEHILKLADKLLSID
jgi:DNA-binding transcriptional LysR family regulator